MARAKKSAKGKKLSLAELPSTAEASAPIDGAAFLAHARPVLASLAKDLLARANERALAHSVLRSSRAVCPAEGPGCLRCSPGRHGAARLLRRGRRS